MSKYAIICNITDEWIFFNDVLGRLANVGEYDLYIVTKLQSDKIKALSATILNDDFTPGVTKCFNTIATKNYAAVLLIDTDGRIIDRHDSLSCCIPAQFKTAVAPKLDSTFGLYGLNRCNCALTNSANYTDEQKNDIFYADKADLITACKSVRCKTLCYDFFDINVEWISMDIIKQFFANTNLNCSARVLAKLLSCCAVALQKKVKSAEITKKYDPNTFDAEYQQFIAELKAKKK